LLRITNILVYTTAEGVQVD